MEYGKINELISTTLLMKEEWIAQSGLRNEEIKILKELNTPIKIQNFIEKLNVNFEENGDTCMSPRMVLALRRAHCIEAALLAGIALRMQGRLPLIVDLESTKEDFDHVIAVFKDNGKWGAISKSNHAVLKYREPVYRDVRELVMSFFHEYFLDNGKKTLRRYTGAINLARFDNTNWISSESDVWHIAEYLADAKHFDILTNSEIKRLRLADEIEIQAGKLKIERDKFK